MDEVTGSTLSGTFASAEQVCLKDFSLPDFHPERTPPKLKDCTFHADRHCNVIVGCDILWAFGAQLDFDKGRLVCNGVSVPMRKFPNDASEATSIEHLSQDHIDHNKENGKDGLSFDNDFVAETLDSSCQVGDI